MTTLRSWMKSNEVSDVDLGKAVGLTRFGVRKIMYGERNPSLSVAAKIEAFTKGAVPATALLKREQTAA